MKCLVFSKARPLQLQGYLDSLASLGSFPLSDVRVILPEADADYRTLAAELKARHGASPVFLAEREGGGFDATLRAAVAELPDHEPILFGCDDVIFFRPLALKPVVDILSAEPGLIGVSLRLGLNIKHRPPPAALDALFYRWRWTTAPWHWGYPFELMASVYTAGMVKAVLAAISQPMRTPNDLENYGVTAARGLFAESRPLMAMFNCSNFAAAQDVNMVQTDYKNAAVGGAAYDPATLTAHYQAGRRLDWAAAFNTTVPDCFLKDSRWRLR